MKLSEHEQKLVIVGYMNGYEQGHIDTVDSGYTDAEESAKDWLRDALDDGGFEYCYKKL